MPYMIEHRKKAPRGKQFVVVHPDGTEAHHATMGDAQAQVKLLQGIDHGMKPHGEPDSEEGGPVESSEGEPVHEATSYDGKSGGVPPGLKFAAKGKKKR